MSVGEANSILAEGDEAGPADEIGSDGRVIRVAVVVEERPRAGDPQLFGGRLGVHAGDTEAAR